MDARISGIPGPKLEVVRVFMKEGCSELRVVVMLPPPEGYNVVLRIVICNDVVALSNLVRSVIRNDEGWQLFFVFRSPPQKDD